MNGWHKVFYKKIKYFIKQIEFTKKRYNETVYKISRNSRKYNRKTKR